MHGRQQLDGMVKCYRVDMVVHNVERLVQENWRRDVLSMPTMNVQMRTAVATRGSCNDKGQHFVCQVKSVCAFVWFGRRLVLIHFGNVI